MTASMGGEVQSNRLFGAAPESTLAGAQAVDGEGEDGRHLVKVVGWGFAVWRERVRAFHVPAAIYEEAYADEKPPDRALWDIRQEQLSRVSPPSAQHTSLAVPTDSRDLRRNRSEANISP
jgi:hypothetical protein